MIQLVRGKAKSNGWQTPHTEFRCHLCHARLGFYAFIDKWCPTCGAELPDVVGLSTDIDTRIDYYYKKTDISGVGLFHQ